MSPAQSSRDLLDCWRTAVGFSLDGRTVATVHGSHPISTMTLWDSESGTKRWAVSVSEVRSLAFTAAGHIVSSGRDGAVTFRVPQTGAIVRELPPRGVPLTGADSVQNLVTAVAVSPDGSHLVCAFNDRTIQVWDLGSRSSLVRELHTRLNPATVLSFSGDSRRLISVGNDPGGRSVPAEVLTWDYRTGDVANVARLGLPVTSAALNREGTMAAVARRDSSIILWDIGNDRQLHVLSGHTHPVRGVAFNPDASAL